MPRQAGGARAKTAAVWGAVLVLCGALLGGAWWARSGAKAPQVQPAEDAPTAVELIPVRHGAFSLRRSYTGTLEPAASFVAAPRVGGRIASIDVDLGDAVVRGQVVARIYDTTLRRELAVAKAQLGVVRARRVAAGNAIETATRNFERAEALAGKGIASSQELDVTRAEQLDAEGDLAIAKAEAARAEAEVAAAAARVEEARVVLAWEGGGEARVVSRRHVDPGETVSANAPVVTVVDLSEVIVVVSVTETDHARLRRGQAVQVRADALGDEVFDGQVDRVAPVLAEGSRRARVEMRLPNADGRLTPGMFVRVEAVLERIEDAAVVPADAVVEREGERVVFGVERGVARAYPVQVRARTEIEVAIAADVLPAEVVVLGASGLQPGGAVRVVTGAPS